LKSVVGLVEVEAVNPIVVVSKKGKGRFYETTEYIQSSTILGGVAREAIINNYLMKFGNCSKLVGPNEAPDCETCGSRENCKYTSIWVKKELKLSYCTPFEQQTSSEPQRQQPPPTLRDPPPILKLQSLFKASESEAYVDGLLYMALYKLATSKGEGVKEEFLLKEIKVDGGRCKKEEESVRLHQDGSIRVLKTSMDDSPHVAINDQFKASEMGLLYNYTTIRKGTRFTATVIGEETLVKELFSDRSISVGSGKSRGYGGVKLKLLETTPIEEFVKERTKAIKDGFRRIKEILGGFLDSQHQDVFFGAVTGLSPLPIEEEERPIDAVARRIGLPSNEVAYLACKCGAHTRYEFNGEGNEGPTLIISPVVNPGYTGVFIVKGDLDAASRRLAEREVNLGNYHPWFGWVTINHPIHFTKVSFGGA